RDCRSSRSSSSPGRRSAASQRPTRCPKSSAQPIESEAVRESAHAWPTGLGGIGGAEGRAAPRAPHGPPRDLAAARRLAVGAAACVDVRAGRRGGTGVAGIADAVVVLVGLIGVGLAGTVVVGVRDAVAVEVVVAHVADAVAVLIALVRVPGV